MPLQAITATEPIPGYRIRERIGAGGYGEVWKADAPGGLVKAIKFVYGFLSEDRASRELKALNRIKMVRHPFLLSLERIEVVDGQLLIVTELAEASLKDRFDQCVAAGLVGIPRDELLRYMRDAADVLDYMSQEHSLQHLDIKPENLLMLAGRVKVADFGLVKDIHDATASMMGGLTPLYAPPEVFDGHPSRWSDQYSLSIVYQEMLTGELPFPGTTAIQLARQHLNAKPRLSALPEHEQEVIARALAKTPQERFDSCRELVDALEHAQPASAGLTDRPRSSSSRMDEQREKSHTEVLDSMPSSRQWFGDTTETPLPRIDPSPIVRDLPPIDVQVEERMAEPTLYLGVGRSAGRILLSLRRKLEDHYGQLTNVPTLQMLLLDTDGKDLLEVSHKRGGFKPHELLGMPLRRPQDYRNTSRDLLQWLSRRWLYNIPRSLKTEGLRPLGRLALVDHADEMIQRAEGAIARATADESFALAEETTGWQFHRDCMRVVVVSSISGGTGSGMVVDLGYLARYLLSQHGFPDDHVTGILTHSTGRNPRTSELSVVNAYSTLCELNHYGRLGSYYPGERSFHLPPRKEDNTAFRDTYLIDMGEGLAEEQFEEAAEKIGTYLYLDTLTNATSFFRACRRDEPRHADTRNAELPIRSFGLHQYSCMQDDVISVAVEHFCRHAIDRWVAGATAGDEGPMLRRSSVTLTKQGELTQEPAYAHLRVPVEQLAVSSCLDVDALIAEVSQRFEEELGRSADVFVREQLGYLPLNEAKVTPEVACESIAQLAKNLDQLLGTRHNEESATHGEPGSLETLLAPARRKLSLERAAKMREWLMQRVEDERDRIRGAQWAAQWLANQCRAIDKRVGELRQGIVGELGQVEQRLDAVAAQRGRAKERIIAAPLMSVLQQFCRLRLYERVAENAASMIQIIKGQLSLTQDELMDMQRELRHLADQFDTSRTLDPSGYDETAAPDELTRCVGQILVDNADRVTAQLEPRFQTEIVQAAGSLRQLLAQGGNERNRLPSLMRAVARTAVVNAMRQLDVADVLFHDDGAERDEVATLKDCLAAAWPKLLPCGGAKRLLLMLPKGSTQVRPIEILHQQLHETPSVTDNCDGDFILCYEAEQISLTQVAVTLIGGRPDLAEAGRRLHTRSDVTWSNLPDLV